MEELKLGAVEAHFADMIWCHAPLTTRALIALCEKELDEIRRMIDSFGKEKKE